MTLVTLRRLAAAFSLLAASAASAQPAEITYQGVLTNNGQPANGNFDMEFGLFDALQDGNQVGPTVGNGAIAVADGQFSIPLDFGAAAYTGADLWLQINVGGTTLTPRTRLTSAPYAVRSLRPWSTNGTSIYYDAGAVGIGTSDPGALLEIRSSDFTHLLLNGPSAVGARVVFADDGIPRYDVGRNAAGNFIIGDFLYERFKISPGRIDLTHDRVEVNAGFMQVNGNTNLNGGCNVSGDRLLVNDQRFIVHNNIGEINFAVETDGDIRASTLYDASGGIPMMWNADLDRIGIQASSRKFKENIEPLDEDFAKIFALAPVSYTSKCDGLKRRQVGYIAEDVHDAGLHSLVIYGEDNLPISIQYDRVGLYLVEVVRDQRTRIAALEDSNRRLAEALLSVEERLTKLESHRVSSDR